MRILFTADNHLEFIGGKGPKQAIKMLAEMASKEGADMVIIGGDMTQGSHKGKNRFLDQLLSIHPRTFFILGNHDLWRGMGGLLPPNETMAKHMAMYFTSGTPLEKSWADDHDTLHAVGDCAVVGTMGFPDFEHPHFATMSKSRLNMGGCTNDMYYMKLSLGWLHYTIPLQNAFRDRLLKAVATDAKNIIVATHYGILDGQYIPSNDDIAAYFRNYTIGQFVVEAAKAHPKKTFWCLSGHSHEYNLGRLSKEADNLYVFGLKTEYGHQDAYVFDTSLEMNQGLEARRVC